MNTPSFKTIHTSVRPSRAAVLIDKNDPNWQDSCLRIIEFYSQVWGGAYNIIVPTDGNTIDAPFWDILEVFDPDHVFYYRKTCEDLRLSAPQRYAALVERELQAYLPQLNPAPSDPEEIQFQRAEIDKQLRRANFETNFGISPALQEQVRVRVAPFFFQQHVVHAGSIVAGSGVPFEFANIVKIAPSAETPKRIARIFAPPEILPPLWFSAVSGKLNEDAAAAFKSIGFQVEDFRFDERTIDQLIEFTTTRNVERYRALLLDNVPRFDLPTAAPFQISMLELGLYRSVKYAYWDAPLVLVAGNTVTDFCLYYCLSRLRDRVVWVLPSITDRVLNRTTPLACRSESCFLSQLHNEEFAQSSSGKLACTSLSLDDTQLAALIQQLNDLGHRSFPQITVGVDVQRILKYPLVAYERDNFQRDIVVQTMDDRSISPFATPKPKHFNPVHPSEHRYITQLSVVRDGTPKHFSLGPITVQHPGLLSSGARVGKDGPAYSCPNAVYFGGDIDTALIRPSLRLLPLHACVEVIAREQKYECRPSDKGIYANESLAKWGGLEELAGFLRDERKRAILDRFLDKSPSKPGRGVYLEDDKRRYLDFQTIERQLDNQTVSFIDHLVTRRVLHRGFIFQCSFCRSSSWFAIGEVSEEFRCRRCNRLQLYKHDNWKMPSEPQWFYKLDELVYQGYRQGMTVPMLTLDYIRRASETFTFTTDRELFRPDVKRPETEVDFFCVPDGTFTAGEAKSEPVLGSSAAQEQEKINKYVRLAAALSIRQLVFSTFSESWKDSTTQRVKNAFKDSPAVRLTFLNRSNLLTA